MNEQLMNEQLMSDFVDGDDNNNADTQQPTLKERPTNNKRIQAPSSESLSQNVE